MSVAPVETSAEFLRAVRTDEDAAPAAERLAALSVADLDGALGSDGARLAFWLNVYNAAAQRALARDPDRYENRRAFFSADLVTVAGRDLSLDAIEHRILRRGYPKWTLGYVRWPFVSDYAERLSPSERDPRMHFALNCGAASCPMILAYTRDGVDAELDRATAQYLAETVEYDAAAGRVYVPRVFLWFRGDFGGKSGILAVLRRYDQLPPDASPRLKHREWDWTLDRGHFAAE